MQDSLLTKLNDAIKARYPDMVRTECDHNELQDILNVINDERREQGLSPYKLGNAERRLRPSDSPSVETIHKDNKPSEAIIGYRWKPRKGITEPGDMVADKKVFYKNLQGKLL